MIRYLFKNTQCDPNVQNHNGEIPLHLACLHSLSIVKEVGAHTTDPNVRSNLGETPLHVACRVGNCNVLKYLVRNMHCDKSVQNDKGQLPLHIACCRLSVNLVEILSNPKDLNIQTTADEISTYFYKTILSGDTPLHIACRTTIMELIRFLLKQKHAKVNVANSVGELPLHVACRSRVPLPLDIVQLLSNCVLDQLNAQIESGDTALHIAIRCSQTDVAKYLLQQKKCKIDIPNEKGELLLHVLCEKAFNQDIMELVSCTENINVRTRSGNTPLHIACRSRKSSTVEYLTKIKGININVINDDKELPLHIACRLCKLNIIKLVSTGSVSVNTRTSVGNTPLHEVFMREYYRYDEKPLDFINYLITDKHCDPSLCNQQNELPLHLACRKGCQLEIVKLVSKLDVTDLQTLSGNSPLHEACKAPSIEHALSIVEYLSEVMHSNSSVQNNDHELPLHLACRRKSLELVKLTSKCNPNHRTIEGNTPLHEVCIHASESSHSYDKFSDSNSRTVKQLLIYLIKELGCNPQCQNKVERTALHYLCESSNDILAIEYLLSASKEQLSVADDEGQTPIMLTTDLEITKLLLKHGADASSLYKMHHEFFRTKTPPPTPLNVLVVGYASMGKTTLIESLKNETCKIFQTEQKPHTAGIIPSDFHSEVYGSVIFYDFAGQHEYYASHEAVVHNIIKKSPPVIVLLINIAKDKEDITKSILYWLSFLENRCTTMKEKPHLIIVGSHADKCTEQLDGSSPEDVLRQITTSLQPMLLKSRLKFIAPVAMDCR